MTLLYSLTILTILRDRYHLKRTMFQEVILKNNSKFTLLRVFSSRKGLTRVKVAWTYKGAERKCIALNLAGNRPRSAAIKFRRAAAPNAPPCRRENPLQSTTATKPDCCKNQIKA